MKILARAALFAMAFGPMAHAQAAPEVSGTWLTEDGRAKIRTEHCGDNKLCGFVVWMKNPLDDNGLPRTDIKNPDPAKRSRPSLGLELMSGLKQDDATHYEGEIYNAEDGKMYNVTVSVEKNEELKVHGCLLRFLCGSQTWTRVADIGVPKPGTVAAAPSVLKPAVSKPPAPQAKHDNAPALAK